MPDQPQTAAAAPPETTAPAKPRDALEQARAEQKARREADRQEVGDFLVFLSTLQRGRTAIKWARALADLNKAVRKHKRKGSMTITISIRPVGTTGDSIQWSDTVSVKPPKGEEPSVVLHHDGDSGKLTLDHPDSISLVSRDELMGGVQ